MTSLVYLLCSLQTVLLQQAPPGTQLSVRLNNSLSSFSSKPGTPVNGILIAPVMLDGRTLVPAGTKVDGRVTRVTRVGLGVVHERAALGLEFDRMTLPDGLPIPLSAQVIRVDNARERVTSAGLIQGIRSTGTISYRVSGYVRAALLWDVHADVAEWAIKSLVLELPEPEIYYPAGTELMLKLTGPATFTAPLNWPGEEPRLPEKELDSLRALISSMPVRAEDPETNRPSDLANVLLIGSKDEIEKAFAAAGWSQAGHDSIRARIGCIRAAAEVHGFTAAPMTPLHLNGVEANMSWQKSLNDVAKRHHIRIWKQPGTWYGQELWLATATRDVDFAYLRPGRPFTHEIDPKIDQERDKVAYDLAFTTCAQPLIWAQRPGMPRFTRNATGDPIATDTRMVAIQMHTCPSEPVADNPDAPVARGGRFQRFVRREIMITRNDFIRTNIYYRSFEASRWAVEIWRYKRKKASEMRTLRAEYGPAGSAVHPVGERGQGLAVQSLR